MAQFKCKSCKREIKNILDLNNLEPLGISIIGRCPYCNARVYANPLWKKTSELDMRDNKDYPVMYNLTKSGTVKKGYYKK